MTDNRTTERVDHPPRVREAIDELMREKDATDNRTTELLPCGHCGSNVELYEFEYPNGEHAYRLMSVLGGCMVCGNIDSIEPTALDAFIAAWNTRTPEQSIAATLGNGTLTAEQVREAIEANSWAETSTIREFNDSSWQAIADELNARAERTCELKGRSDTCTKCGASVERVTHSVYEMGDGFACHPNYCPNCGALVVDA